MIGVRAECSDQSHAERSKVLEKQVEMYGYSTCKEPPRGDEFADYLASNGEAAIPYVLARLEANDERFGKDGYLSVLLMMHRRYYSLRNEPGLIGRLKTDVAAIKFKHDRDDAEESLSKVETEPGLAAK